jgi:hypothetical protein
MKRTRAYRRSQRHKRENKVKYLIKDIWQEKYHEDYHWTKIMIDTPKMCNGLCCKNPRKLKGTNTLTMQELKNKNSTKTQIGEYHAPQDH